MAGEKHDVHMAITIATFESAVNGPTGRKYNFVDSTRPKCLVKIYKFGKA
jgi:hypothetical protein